MRTPCVLVLLAGLVAAVDSPAFAQAAQAADAPAVHAPVADRPMPRGYLTVNAGYQPATNSFASAWSYDANLETATITSSYSAKPGVLFDVGAGARLGGNFTLGAAFSRYQRSGFASLQASVPSPLYYNEPRSFEGTAAGPQRTETAVHLQAMWTIAASRNVDVGIFGGPSFFNVRQVVITKVAFNELYPYDKITVSSTSTEALSATKTGFNVGADFTYLVFGPRLGVGMLVRYSGVTVGLKSPGGNEVQVKAGGLAAGAGIRVRF